MHRFATILNAVALLAVLPACTSQGTRISTNSPEPLRADFDVARTRVINDQYLVLPVELAQSKHAVFSSGSFVYSKEAWFGGSVFTSGNTYGEWLNLTVIDLRNRSTRTVFDRQVALSEWRTLRQGNLWQAPAYTNTLLLCGRTRDTNDDQNIDHRDARMVYAYDLATATLRQLSPDGHSVIKMHEIEDRLIFVMRKLDDWDEVSVFTCDPLSGEGSFVADSMTP